MKQLLQQYAAYNHWANKVLTDRIAQLPEEIITKETPGSFPSLFATVVHLVDIESIWWQRMRLQEQVEWPGKTFQGDFEALSRQLLLLSQQWYEWIAAAHESSLIHVFAYYNSQKEYFKQPVCEMLMHLFNHQSYHRGQLVAMLRQNGIRKIPRSDFIVFSRKKEKIR